MPLQHLCCDLALAVGSLIALLNHVPEIPRTVSTRLPESLHLCSVGFKMSRAINTVVCDTILKYSQRHVANEDIASESKLRHASNDACGVEYSVTYTRAAGSADGAIAIRTEWPKKLAYNLTLQNIMPRVVSTAPVGVELISATSRTAIVALLLTRNHQQVDDSVLAAAQWLASLRCVHFA